MTPPPPRRVLLAQACGECENPVSEDVGHYSAARLRQGAAWFLTGKLASAALSLAAFALTARLLGVGGLGDYAAIAAGGELAMAACTLGLDWVSARYVPEYRVHGNRRQLAGVVLVIVAVQAAALGASALVLLVLARPLAAASGLPAGALEVFALVLWTEGTSRVLRDQCLGALLAQRQAQVATIARAAVLVAALALASRLDGMPQPDVKVVFLAEATASMVSLVLGAALLLRQLARHRPDPGVGDWTPPPAGPLVRMARNAFVSSLQVGIAGAPTLTLLLRGLAGAEVAGAFGFARGLVDQFRRLMPMELLLGVARPAIASRWAAHRDFAALQQQVGLLQAGSLLLALPFLALFFGQAGLVASVVGGSEFAATSGMLALWTFGLLTFIQRRSMEILAYTVGHSEFCVVAGMALMAGPLMLASALLVGLGPLWGLTVVLLCDLAFSRLVALQLRRCGHAYAWPASLPTAVVVLALSAGLLSVLPLGGIALPTALVLATAAAMLLAWGSCAALRPLSDRDRELIRRTWPRAPVPF